MKETEQGPVDALGPVGHERALDKAKVDELVEKRGQQFVLKAEPNVVLDARAHKMSKSRGNVVNPDDIVQEFGADSLRLYEMFMGPLEATKPWSTEQHPGRAAASWTASGTWRTRAPSEERRARRCARLTHRTIRKVAEDMEAMRFNTAISAMMVLNNELHGMKRPPRVRRGAGAARAPLRAARRRGALGAARPRALDPAHAWPTYDPALFDEEVVEVPVQINGKVRGRVQLGRDAAQDVAIEQALSDPGVQAHLAGKVVKKVVYVPGKILNFIV